MFLVQIIIVNNEKYLFQEEIGKRFIESNDKREGIILKIMNKDPIRIESTKGEIYPLTIIILLLIILKTILLILDILIWKL